VAGPRTRPANKGIALIALLIGGAIVLPQPGHAQGLFDLLFGALRGAAPRAYNREPPPRLLENFPGAPGGGEERVTGDSVGGPSVSYCVRTCDGKYFPLPASSGGQNATPANLCSSMCPSAETKVYSGSSIDGAVASDGKPYRTLKNAFLYREKIVSNCTCNGRDTNGLTRMDPKQDPTLRPGDIVVTAEGPLVFKGRNAKRGNEFVSASEDKSLPKGVRATLSDMRIAPSSPVATARTGALEEGRAAGVASPAGDSAQAPKTP
jgi:hypothetical protein